MQISVTQKARSAIECGPLIFGMILLLPDFSGEKVRGGIVFLERSMILHKARAIPRAATCWKPIIGVVVTKLNLIGRNLAGLVF